MENGQDAAPALSRQVMWRDVMLNTYVNDTFLGYGVTTCGKFNAVYGIALSRDIPFTVSLPLPPLSPSLCVCVYVCVCVSVS